MLDAIFRSLPDFKGKRRLARLLFKNEIREHKDIEVKGRMNCTYLLPNIRENVAFSIYINGIYEQDTVQLLDSLIPVNGILLDLGTNIGSISIPLCKSRPDIKVYGVEASPWVFEYLEGNIKKNQLQSHITVFNNALFDEDNKILPFYSPKEKFGSGSLSGTNQQEQSINVESIKLDTLITELGNPEIDCIKIDIEGFEYFAFRGGENLLKSDNAPDILFEFGDWNEKKAGLQPGASQQVLISYGYHIYQMQNGKRVRLNNVFNTGFHMLLASKK